MEAKIEEGGEIEIKSFLFVCSLIFGCAGSLLLGAFSSCSEQGLLFTAELELLTAGASLIAEHGLQVLGLQELQHVGSAVVARGLRCPSACGILPQPGMEPVSPALADRFLAPGPPGKSLKSFLDRGH